MSLLDALNDALMALPMQPEDGAVVALARAQAEAIDEADDALKKLGPHLLETLVELRMTPKARNAIVAPSADTEDDKITDLRSRRQKRAAQ